MHMLAPGEASESSGAGGLDLPRSSANVMESRTERAVFETAAVV